MNALLWGTLIVVLILIWFRLTKRLYNDLLSPFNLLLIGWIVPVLLGRMHLSAWQKPWSLEVSVILASVTFGLVTTTLFFNRHTFRLESPSARTVFADTVRLFQNRLFLVLVCILFTISFAAYLKNDFIDNPGGIPLITFLENPTLSREPFHLWGKGNDTANHYARLIEAPLHLIIGMLYLGFRVNARGRIKWGLLLLISLYPIMCLLKMSRIDLIFAGVAIGFVEYYYRKLGRSVHERKLKSRWTARKWVRLTCVTTVILVTASVGLNNFQRVRSSFTKRHMAGNLVGIDAEIPDLFYGVIVEGYAFFALPFDNFVDYYESYPGGYHVGIGFFRPLLSLSGQGRVADEMIASINFAPLFGYINTAPFITIIYPELGIVGVLFVPIIYAILVNGLYVRFKAYPSFGRLFSYITFSISWMLMSSTIEVFNLSCYLNILFVVVLEVVAEHFFYYRKPVPLNMERVTRLDRGRLRRRIAKAELLGVD